MKKIALYSAIAVAALLGSCKKSSTPTLPQSKCMADNMKLTETKVADLPSSHTLQVTFDVKNTSSDKYDVGSGSNPIYIKLQATTTNSKTYEEETILTVSNLAAGATGSATASVDYGAGNVYKSYVVKEVYCK